MNTLIVFGVGFAIGCLTGVLLVALCVAARAGGADEDIFDEYGRRL